MHVLVIGSSHQKKIKKQVVFFTNCYLPKIITYVIFSQKMI